MPQFNRIQDRHSTLDQSVIPYHSFYISDPPASSSALIYELNRAGALHRFPARFCIRRDADYPFTALICITEGKGSVRIDGATVSFSAGQVLLLPPYTVYEYSSDARDPFSIVWAEFCGGDSERIVRHLMAHNGVLFSGDVFASASMLCLALVHPPQTQRMSWISQQLYAALLMLSEACPRETPRPNEQIYRILDYMDQHLEDNLTLTSLADIFGYSAPYFSRFFLQHTSTHFTQYLLRRRVERARQMLLSTDLPMDQLAQQLGFYDASHFIRKFREITGESPARYRRAHLTEKP